MRTLLTILLLIPSLFVLSQTKGEFTDKRDNKTYKWVQIGDQIWMAENLAYRANENCWTYNNNPKLAKRFGHLYLWKTAKKVCPEGWHLPSDDEWSKLFSFLRYNDYRNVEGEALKAKTDWHGSGVGTNDYNFSALPGGNRTNKGDFFNGGSSAFFWTSTEYDGSSARYWCLTTTSKGMERSMIGKDFGLSVRCVKDE